MNSIKSIIKQVLSEDNRIQPLKIQELANKLFDLAIKGREIANEMNNISDFDVNQLSGDFGKRFSQAYYNQIKINTLLSEIGNKAELKSKM